MDVIHVTVSCCKTVASLSTSNDVDHLSPKTHAVKVVNDLPFAPLFLACRLVPASNKPMDTRLLLMLAAAWQRLSSFTPLLRSVLLQA